MNYDDKKNKIGKPLSKNNESAYNYSELIKQSNNLEKSVDYVSGRSYYKFQRDNKSVIIWIYDGVTNNKNLISRSDDKDKQ